MSDSLGEFVIETEALTKRYGPVEAVSDLTLKVRPGSITAFLGRNGAGKSTTIKMLLGIVRPSAGTGLLLGRSIDDAQACRDARRHVPPTSTRTSRPTPSSRSRK